MLKVQRSAEQRKSTAKGWKLMAGGVAAISGLFYLLGNFETGSDYGGAAYSVEENGLPSELDPMAPPVEDTVIERDPAAAVGAAEAAAADLSADDAYSAGNLINSGARTDRAEYETCNNLEDEIQSGGYTVDNSDEYAVDTHNGKVDRFNRECAGSWRIPR